MHGVIYKKLRQSYILDKALIPILEAHLKQGGQYAQVHRCMQKILRETRQKAGKTEEYLRLLRNRSQLS